MAAALALATGTHMLDPPVLEEGCAARGIDHDGWFAALVDLRRRDLIALQTAEPSFVVLAAMTNAGLQRHLRRTRPDLDQVKRRLAAVVVKAEGQGLTDLAQAVSEPALLVECVLDRWVNDGRLVYSKAPGRRFRIHRLLSDLPM